MSLYLSRIEGPPPKRNAPGSNPGRDATKNAESLCFSRVFGFIFIYTCYNLTQIIYCGRSASLRLRTLYS